MGDDDKKDPQSDDIEFVGAPEDMPEERTSGGAADAELKKAKEDYLYLAAEFENYKRNAIKERSELLKYGGERIIRELLDILDTFDRALQMEVTAENIASFREGMDMTAKELRNVLSRFGVNEIDPQNAPFDPSVHEALSSEETDKVPPGHISQVFKKAYKLHDRLIRPAQVVVAKEPAKKSDPAEE